MRKIYRFFFSFAEDINWYLNTEYLPSKQFPMVFKSVQGICEHNIANSYYNQSEIDEVLRTIKSLLPPDAIENGLRRIQQTDIGVVTPYRKQRRQIAKQLRRYHFNDVCVGTTEVFQGSEKPIMIISTVRSNGMLGFVSDARVCVDF